MRVLRDFYEMLKMAWNVSKMNLRRFGAFWNFARTLTRGRAHARAFFDRKLIGRILTLIVLNMNGNWLSVMKLWSFEIFQKKTQNGAWMTSWRLDDLEKVPVTSHDKDLWLCLNWKKLTGRILSYRLHKKVGRNKNKEIKKENSDENNR